MIGDDQKIMIAKQVFTALTDRYKKLSNNDMLKIGTHLLENTPQKQYFEVEVPFHHRMSNKWTYSSVVC